jgi:LytS/YehU family sensor histidine kinase
VFLDRPSLWLAHHLKWLPLVAATFLIGIYGLRHGVYASLGLEYRHASWTFVVVYETVKIVLFSGLWLGIIFGFNSYGRWQDERQSLLTLQRSLAEAQLAQLRSQLRPHLFFNVLNTISALMHTDVERADRLLARLGDLLRTTLQSGDRDLTTLRDELRLLRLYADVMQERFEDRVTIEWHVEQGIDEAAVPALILQPLLENAFKHAVETSRDHVRIDVAAQRHGDRLFLCVRNSGGQLAANVRRGIGLRNCEERLRVLFGAQTQLALSQQGGFVDARIELPWRRHVA